MEDVELANLKKTLVASLEAELESLQHDQQELERVLDLSFASAHESFNREEQARDIFMTVLHKKQQIDEQNEILQTKNANIRAIKHLELQSLERTKQILSETIKLTFSTVRQENLPEPLQEQFSSALSWSYRTYCMAAVGVASVGIAAAVLSYDNQDESTDQSILADISNSIYCSIKSKISGL